MWKTCFSWLIIGALLGCQKPAPQNPPPLQKISFAYTVQPQSTLVHMAVTKGFFAEQGLEVQSLRHTFGKAALQDVLDGKADFATVAETPIMFSVLNGKQIFVVANIESSSKNNAVVARIDAGVTEASDLKGKRIGYTPGTTSDFFLDSLLTANGLTRLQIQPVALKPEEMQQAIMVQEVDAVSTLNYPLTLIRQQLGANGTIFYDEHIYTETFNIAAEQAFVRQNLETVKRVLRALIKAEHFVAKNPDEAQTLMSAAINIDKALIHEVWDAFNYRVVLDATLLITLEDETRWAMQHKLTDQTVMPNYLDFIHFDSLKAVKPDAVKLSR